MRFSIVDILLLRYKILDVIDFFSFFFSFLLERKFFHSPCPHGCGSEKLLVVERFTENFCRNDCVFFRFAAQRTGEKFEANRNESYNFEWFRHSVRIFSIVLATWFSLRLLLNGKVCSAFQKVGPRADFCENLAHSSRHWCTSSFIQASNRCAYKVKIMPMSTAFNPLSFILSSCHFACSIHTALCFNE